MKRLIPLAICTLLMGCTSPTTASTPSRETPPNVVATPAAARENLSRYSGAYYFDFIRQHPEFDILRNPALRNRAAFAAAMDGPNNPAEIVSAGGRKFLMFSTAMAHAAPDANNLIFIDVATHDIYAVNYSYGDQHVGLDQNHVGRIIAAHCDTQNNCTWTRPLASQTVSPFSMDDLPEGLSERISGSGSFCAGYHNTDLLVVLEPGSRQMIVKEGGSLRITPYNAHLEADISPEMNIAIMAVTEQSRPEADDIVYSANLVVSADERPITTALRLECWSAPLNQ